MKDSEGVGDAREQGGLLIVRTVFIRGFSGEIFLFSKS